MLIDQCYVGFFIYLYGFKDEEIGFVFLKKIVGFFLDFYVFSMYIYVKGINQRGEGIERGYILFSYECLLELV